MDGIQKKPLLHVYVLIISFVILVPFTSLAEMDIKNKHSDAINDEIKKAREHLNSDDFTSRLRDYIDQLNKKELPAINNLIPYIHESDKSSEVKGTYYLFISSSIPIDTLRAYAHDISENSLPVKMILRGFIKGMRNIKPTIEFLRDIIMIDQDCSVKCRAYDVGIEIDPELFSKYKIKSVPAFAHESGSKILYGDANLAYLIERAN